MSMLNLSLLYSWSLEWGLTCKNHADICVQCQTQLSDHTSRGGQWWQALLLYTFHSSAEDIHLKEITFTSSGEMMQYVFAIAVQLQSSCQTCAVCIRGGPVGRGWWERRIMDVIAPKSDLTKRPRCLDALQPAAGSFHSSTAPFTSSACVPTVWWCPSDNGWAVLYENIHSPERDWPEH